MNVWLWAAAGLLVCLFPCLLVCFSRSAEDRLAGLEFTGVVVTLELALLSEGLRRPSFFDLPLTLALLAFGGGLVFARFLQRWL